jgi:hypothetical protein
MIQGFIGRVSAALDAVAEEPTQVVRLMHGLNRYRFAHDPESLAEWESARNVIGPAKSEGLGGRADSPRQTRRH